MGVVVDMLNAVTVVAVAAAAIAKFQLGMFGVGAAADGALVAVGPLPVLTAVTAGPVGGGAGVGAGPLRFRPGGRAVVDAQGGEKVLHIAAEEDQVVDNGTEREDVPSKEGEGYERQIHDCQVLHPNGDDEKQKHLIFRAQRGVDQQEGIVEGVDAGTPAGNHSQNVDDDDTSQIIEVELQHPAPALNDAADPVVQQAYQKKDKGLSLIHI